MLKRLSLPIVALLVCMFSFESGARADFYAGKTITIVVNYGPGSGADVLARLFAEHLRKHLAGNPTIIVENMPGAGGLAAQNAIGLHIGSKLDGLTVGFFQVETIAAIIGDPALKISISDLVLIGGLAGQTVAYARKDMPPGLTRPADIVKASKIYAAGYSRSSPPDTKFRLSFETLGVKAQIVTGFPGSADTTKALMQNEVNVASGSVPVYLRTIVPQLVKKNVVIPLWYWPVYGRDSQIIRNTALDDLGVQAFTDVYKEAFGKEPEGSKFKALMLVSDVGAQLNQGMFVAPGTPEEAVNELRQAYNALRNDSDFLHDFRRTILGQSDAAADPSIAAIGPDFVTAEEGEAIFSRIRKMSPDVKDIVRHTVGAE